MIGSASGDLFYICGLKEAGEHLMFKHQKYNSMGNRFSFFSSFPELKTISLVRDEELLKVLTWFIKQTGIEISRTTQSNNYSSIVNHIFYLYFNHEGRIIFWFSSRGNTIQCLIAC